MWLSSAPGTAAISAVTVLAFTSLIYTALKAKATKSVAAFSARETRPGLAAVQLRPSLLESWLNSMEFASAGSRPIQIL